MSETPVLVGIAQNEQRPVDPQTSKEPLILMLEALKSAAEDAGAPALLTDASSGSCAASGHTRTRPG